MSSAAVPKRRRRGKSKRKPPLSVTEIFARFTTDEKKDKDERCCDVAESPSAASKGEPHATPVTPPKAQCKEESPSNRNQSEANTGEIQKETDFVGEKDVVACETQALEGLTEVDAMNIAMQLRATLEEKGPSHENDLLATLSPSQSQQILAAHGTLFAFLDRQPGFQVQHELPHSLIYYHNHDGSDESIQVGASIGPTPSSSSVNEHRCSDDHALSDAGNECAVCEDDDGQEKCRMTDRSIQVTSPPGRKTRGVQKAEQMTDSGAQTQISDMGRLAQLQAMLRNRDAQIAALKKKFETVLESNAAEIQLLHMKIATLPKKSSTVPPTSTTQVKKNRPTKESTCTDQAGAQISPGPSQRQPQLRKSLPLRPTQPEVKPRLPPVVAMDQADKTSRKRGKRRPGPQFCEVPGSKKQMAAPFLNAESKETRLPDHKKQIAAPVRNVESAQSRLPSHKKQIAAPFRNVESTQSRLPDHKKQIAAPFRNIESTQSRLPNPKKQIAAPFRSVESAQSRLPDRKKQIAAPVRNVESTQPRLPDRKRQIAAPVRNVESTQPRLPDRKKQIAAPVRNVESTQSRLPDHKKQIAAPSRDVKSALSTVSVHKKQNAAPRPNVEPMQSGQVGSPSKRDMERKLSRIVQMVRKKHPEHTEEDTRRSIDNVRRSKGGFSRMTFNAIVALVHSDLEASRKENH